MRSVAPFDIATCMYYTGIEPFSKNRNDRKLQRALMQFFKPETISRCARR